jgi:rhamnose utilization protein RhaD (predicted bifunctional aldolase and dehydrogenase)
VNDSDFSTSDPVLDRLHGMARHLADPSRDYAILAEGNVSASIGADKSTFWLKASGCMMGSMRADQFVKMNTGRALAILDHDDLTDEQIKTLLRGARENPDDALHPSVEAALHAVCLTDGAANVVGHTHPTAWLSILCSERAEAAIAGRLFPDEIVVCGPSVCFVPYVDPGPPLAKACRSAIRAYVSEWGEPPKVMLLRNHGLFALGKDADEVERITAMSVKVARALIGAFSLGGPRFLTPAEADRIRTRPDEHLRQKMLASGSL